MSKSATLSLARQAIFDDEVRVCGYELVYRSERAGNGTANADAAGDAPPPVLSLAEELSDIGLASIVGDAPVWVDLGDAVLTHDISEAFSPARTVVQIFEPAAAGAGVVDAVAKLRADGYRVALDDFVYRPEFAPLVELADVVKIDVLAHDDDELAERVRLVAAQGVELLAGNVGTYDELARCRDLGFTFFQGFFLCVPRELATTRGGSDATIRMQLTIKLNDPEADFDALASLIAADVTLSYRLLKYLNSAYVGLGRPVGSIREALALLGSRRVRDWATSLLTADAGADRHELVVNAFVRARMCESLASSTSRDADRAFLAGLLSVVDALTDRPLLEVIDELPVDEELKDAVTRHDGGLGDLVARVIAHEQGHFAAAAAPPLDARTTTRAYVEAIDWSTRTIDVARTV
jgi:EAL and modified HD-GYP domain-containing signal transduction protein